ncbi:carbamoyl phosphate synthase small subunit [Bhargavaea ginsengi]|uniref:carbamoyl phosphate synthase small subunit n=1 Tax=Bhargavaea ginsengi TaxID=426757 RepID=UPI00203EBF57|nr:carbamoyl phosphate synthase small subunit [Bhargavaea ginsengi]MCM3086472.1 carbamoyl phosphate synthase small subunit [Bhargavaea ginsengi]
MKQGYLILETGEVFEGLLAGEFSGETEGEVVFNTSMSGYQEIITDPSYAGQIIVFAYPLIGNYGVSGEDDESVSPHLRGIVTGEMSSDLHHHRATGSLQGMMEENRLPCLTDIDTRSLVRTIRKKGTVRGVISERKDAVVQAGEDGAMFDRVTTNKVKTYGNRGPHVVLLDYGYKKSILDYLLEQRCKVTVVPYHHSIQGIRGLNPDGVVISNGPGNPEHAADQIEKIRELTDSFPTLGICLGHQLIAMAYGAKTTKLHFGHRGGNHPVKDLTTGKTYITSQNHGYVVQEETIDNDLFEVSFRNINDGSVEGLLHKKKPVLAVQFHPEGHPGPLDTVFIFEQFVGRLKESRLSGTSIR